jgi:hypothetical protein
MGMLTRIQGYVSSEDIKYKKHSKVLIACIEAGVSELPKETAEYFGSKYVDKCLLYEKIEVAVPYSKYTEDYADVYEIIVSEIPDDVHKIRFVNCW